MNYEFIDEMDLKNMRLDRLFSRVLMCSYMYYDGRIESPWTDSQYDYACKRLHDEYDNFDHVNKNLLSRESLKTGSGFSIKYTERIRIASEIWRNIYKKQIFERIENGR